MSENLQANDTEATFKAGGGVGIANAREGQGGSRPKSMMASKRNKGAPRMGRASKLRLLARLHGKGLVTWSGPPITVVYDLDVFEGGSSRTASGFLDGDFTAAHASDETADPAPVAARLRLEGEGEVQIEVIVVASDLAEFEAHLTPAQTDLLSSRR
jgi:hypothetical protein